MAYELEGSMLEVCNCEVLCPCWIGADPDNGTCDAALCYHVDKGTANGVDVSGLSIALIAHLPGNPLKGNWKTAVFVDDKASADQEQALLAAWTGKLGGPLADIAGLIGEVVSVERKSISFKITEGEGTFTVAGVVDVDMTPFVGATGQKTVLAETAFSSIPGSPAYVAQAQKFVRTSSSYGLKDLNLSGKNAIQGSFRFAA